MTSLSTQLSRLQSAQAVPRTLDKNSTFSLLFDFKTAAAFPVDTIYSLAYSGFQSLLKLDPSFSSFGEAFFPATVYNKPVIRENMLEQENNDLHAKLQDFLLKLAGFFLREDAQKVIELLIKAYEVHRYEAEELIVGYMNYHKTVEYMKLLQNVNLMQKQQWAFLEPIVKTGENKLDRTILVRKIEENPGLLEVFTKMDLKIWKLTAKSNENGVFSLKEKRLKSTESSEIQIYHRFLVALIFDCLRDSRKLRANQVFVNGLLNYIADLVRNKETVASGIMIFIEVIEKNLNINRKIIEAFVKECLEKAKNEEIQENIEKILSFVVYLSQRGSLSDESLGVLVDFWEKKAGDFRNFIENTNYDLKKLFSCVFNDKIHEYSDESLEIVGIILEKIKKNSKNSELDKKFFKEILEAFLSKSLELNNPSKSSQIYQKTLHLTLSTDFPQVFYQRMSTSSGETRVLFSKLMVALSDLNVLPAESLCFEFKQTNISINLGLFSENREIRVRSLERLVEVVQNNPEKLTDGLEKLLLIAAQNDRSFEVLERILTVLIMKNEGFSDVDMEIIKVFQEIGVKNKPKNSEILKKMAVFCELKLKNKEKIEVSTAALVFAMAAKHSENTHFFNKTLEIVSKACGEGFPYDPSKKEVFHRISASNTEKLLVFIEKTLEFDPEIAISVLSISNKLNLSEKIDFLIKNKKKTVKIDKKPVFSHLIATATSQEEKYEIFGFVLSESEPWTISFLTEIAEDVRFLVGLLARQLESPMANELKNIKILVFLNRKFKEKKIIDFLAENPEIYMNLVVVFLLMIKNGDMGADCRRFWLEVIDLGRKPFKKDGRVLDLKGVTGVLGRAQFELKGFSVKTIRKIVKNILRLRVLLVQSGTHIDKLKHWFLLEPIFDFLSSNLQYFKSDSLALGLLDLITSHDEGNYSQNRDFIDSLKQKSRKNEHFYRNFLKIMMKFGELNKNFSEILEFTDSEILENPRFFAVFLENITIFQSTSDFFALLSESNQLNLLETLIKSKDINQISPFLDKIQLDPSLISSLISPISTACEFQALHRLFLVISRQSLVSIGIYTETQAFLSKFLEKPANFPQKNQFLSLIYRVLTENLSKILVGKSILFDFQGKKSAKDYQVHVEDLMGSYLAGKGYKNLNIAIKLLNQYLNHGGDIGKFGVVIEILEFLAVLAGVSFKAVSKAVEPVATGLQGRSDEDRRTADELLGFFVGKLANKEKIGQFLVIQVKGMVRRVTARPGDTAGVFEEMTEKLIGIYGRENIDALIITVVSLFGKEKAVGTMALESFAGVLGKMTSVKEIFKGCERGLAFLKLFLEKKELKIKRKIAKNDRKQEKSLEFLKRKMFRTSKSKDWLYVFKSFLVFQQFILKSKTFHKALTQNIRRFDEFTSECSIFLSKLLALDQTINRILRASIFPSKKLSFLSNKKALKKIAGLLGDTLDHIHGLLPVELILNIIALVMSSHSQNLDFKAYVLKSLRLRVLHKPEIARRVSSNEKQGLVREILRGLFQDAGRCLREKKGLAFIRISLILVTELIGEGGFGENIEEIRLDQSFLLLDTEKLDIVGLNLVFLSRLSNKNSSFLPQIIENLERIMGKTLELLSQEQEPQQSQSVVDLAVVALSSFIRNLDVLLNPYIPQIEACLFKLASVQSLEVLMILAESVSAKNLLKPLFVLSEDLKDFDLPKVTGFLKRILEGIDNNDFQEMASEIQKTLVKILDFTRLQFVDKEMEDLDWNEVEKIEDGACECYAEFAVKCNEVQMKKFFLQVVNWSEKKLEIDTVGFRFPLYKKLVFFRLVGHVFNRLGQFFVGFFSYFLESTLGLINETHEVFKEKTQKAALGKRKRDLTEEFYTLYSKLIVLVVETLNKLFRFDKEEFIDTQKYEKLLDHIPNLFELNRIPEFTQSFNFELFYRGPLKDLIIGLLELVNDDYKWKSLHYNLLLKTRSEEKSVRLAVVSVISEVIDALKERYVVLISDLMPFLNELLDDREVEIEKVCKEIVSKLEKVSGENIREYLRKL